MEDDARIGTLSECACCGDDVPLFPAIARLTCGEFLSKAIFAESVRPDIPDEAETMSWLTVIGFQEYTGTSSKDYFCDYYGSASFRQETSAITGAYYRKVYDPLDDCSLTKSAGGTGTRTDQSQGGACDVPPDTSVTSDRIENHTMAVIFGDPGTTYTGTLNGAPITGGVSVYPPLFDFLNQGIYTYPAWSYTIDITTVSVIETWTRAGTISDDDGPRGSISEAFEHGYSDPDDYRLEVTVDDLGGTLRFQQVRATIYFTPAGGEETVAGTIELDWKKGDPLVSTHAYPYPEIGTFRLGRVQVRNSRAGKFHSADVVP